jgi:pimeloyl-ACP methyl ester carboxylesterase
MFLATDPEGYARCCEAIAGWDVRGGLGGVRVPTLCVAGADDPATPVAELESIAREIPGARVAVVAQARHVPNVERPREFEAALFEHL